MFKAKPFQITKEQVWQAFQTSALEPPLREHSNFAKFTYMSRSHRQSNSPVLNDSASIAAQCARRLFELRRLSGETQKQFAARVRMTESMISRLERGDHVPSLATLCRIADGFGRKLEIVFHEHEHRHEDGTRHSHAHSHDDPAHNHDHDEEG